MRYNRKKDKLMETITHTQFLNPQKVLQLAGVASGDRVADFGCASGYFSFPCAHIVGEEGHVTAIDVLPHVLSAVESEAQRTGVRNITTRHANLEVPRGSGLEDASVDWVIMKNVLFMSTDRDGMMAEAARVLVPGGKALVVEWNSTVKPGMGPVADKRITVDSVRALAEAHGLTFVTNVSAGDYHYGMIFAKEEV